MVICSFESFETKHSSVTFRAALKILYATCKIVFQLVISDDVSFCNYNNFMVACIFVQYTKHVAH